MQICMGRCICRGLHFSDTLGVQVHVGVCGCGYVEADSNGGLWYVCTPTPGAMYVFACVAVSRRRLGLCAHGAGTGAECHLDADEDHLNDREDELQL